jgi:hypothetical protein
VYASTTAAQPVSAAAHPAEPAACASTAISSSMRTVVRGSFV